MSMIKRGNSDNTRPTVITINYRCATCGHFEQGTAAGSTCPTCQTSMLRVAAAPKPIIPPECPGGICNLIDTDTI